MKKESERPIDAKDTVVLPGDRLPLLSLVDYGLPEADHAGRVDVIEVEMRVTSHKRRLLFLFLLLPVLLHLPLVDGAAGLRVEGAARARQWDSTQRGCFVHRQVGGTEDGFGGGGGGGGSGRGGDDDTGGRFGDRSSGTSGGL